MRIKTNIQVDYRGKFTKLPKSILRSVSGQDLRLWCFLESSKYAGNLSQSQLAESICCSENTIPKSLCRLRESGFIINRQVVIPTKNYVELPKFAYKILTGAELSVLAYILSKKSDQYWNFRDKRITNEIKPSYVTVQKALNSLESHGILKRNAIPNSRRKVYILTEFNWPNDFKDSLFDEAVKQTIPNDMFQVYLRVHNENFRPEDQLRPLSCKSIKKFKNYFLNLLEIANFNMTVTALEKLVKRFFATDSCSSRSDAGFPIFVKWIIQQCEPDYRGYNGEPINVILESMEDNGDYINNKLVELT